MLCSGEVITARGYPLQKRAIAEVALNTVHLVLLENPQPPGIKILAILPAAAFNDGLQKGC